MTANETQIGGTHYKDMAVQPWDAMRAWMSPEAFRGYLQGCCLKYLARHELKGGVEDLRKCRHYLDKLIESYPPSPMETTMYFDTSITEDEAAAALGITSPATEWPGPDWSQAPEWANWWVHDKAMDSGIWVSCELSHWNGDFWAFSRATPSSRSAIAPGFGYPGDWRDSLRKRPQ